MAKYVIISKGLSIIQLRKNKLVKKYAFRGKIFENKSTVTAYFNKLPYMSKRNQKIVKAE